MKATRDQLFDHVLIIYNPHASSQRAERIAARLKRRLVRQGIQHIEMAASKQPGHARELANKAARQYAMPLVISVSGDGGYNEVINGLMDAVDAGQAKTPYAAVEAAGNANDHYKVVREKSLALALKRQQVLAIDLLFLEAKAKDFELSRYAHSYIGFGVTPYIARELNKSHLTRWQELQMLARMVAKFPPFEIQHPDGNSEKLDSLIFSNIRRMAKVLQVAKQTKPDDGTFEVVKHPHQRRRTFVLTAVKLAVRGRKSSQKTTRYRFTLPHAQAVQFDGEVVQLPAHCQVTITCKPQTLRTF